MTNWEDSPCQWYNSPLSRWNQGPLPLPILWAGAPMRACHKDWSFSTRWFNSPFPRGRSDSWRSACRPSMGDGTAVHEEAAICCKSGQSCPNNTGQSDGGPTQYMNYLFQIFSLICLVLYSQMPPCIHFISKTLGVHLPGPQFTRVHAQPEGNDLGPLSSSRPSSLCYHGDMQKKIPNRYLRPHRNI